jgi:predicted permease
VAPPGLPRLDEIAVDGAVLWFTAGISILSGILFGLAPVLAAPLASLNAALKEGGRSADGRGARRLRAALVMVEVSLSVVLLAGAGLLIRSFDLLGRVAPGFQAPPDRILSLQLSPASRRYRDPKALTRYWQELVARIRQLPGIDAAAIALAVPPDRTPFTDAFEIPGRTPREGPPPVPVPFVSVDYFRALGIPLLRGRTFDSRDTPDSPRVTVISETLARRYFGNENPVGQRLKHGGPQLNNPYMEIIGVVGDVKYDGLAEANEPVYYEASDQNAARPMWLVVRTRADALSFLAAVRGEIRAIDPDVPVTQPGTMAQALDESVALPRFRSSLMAIFAATALLLAGVGIYGVIAYSVTRRTQEIGIRMALGASRSGVLRLILVQGSRLALIGIVVGLPGAILFVRTLGTMLFGVSPADPLTFATVVIVLGGSALLASFIPARRAARVNPVQALRQE